MAQQILKNPLMQMELVLLFREMDDISQNLSSYFEYCQARQTLLKDMLAKSSLN